MPLKYLITGATGGLGAHVLSHLIANVPTSEYAASSSDEANRCKFEDQGTAFRVLNYDDRETLEIGLKDVENFFFVSSNTHDPERRIRQHQNVVDAAKKVDVQHVCFHHVIVPFIVRRARLMLCFLVAGLVYISVLRWLWIQ